MSRSDGQRIEDILEACGELSSLVGPGRSAFDNDRTLRLAVERLLEIVCEAATNLTDETRGNYPDVPWADIMGLRIVLAHRYHRVDADQVWTTAAVDIPALSARLQDDSPS